MSEAVPSNEPETLAGNEGKGVERLARIYAEAFMNVTEKAGVTAAVGVELESIVRDVVGKSPTLEAFLVSPTIKRGAREPVIRKAFTGSVSDLVLDFLLVLNHHDRMNLLRPVAMQYRELGDRLANRQRVYVRTAAALDDGQKAELLQALRATLKSEPVLDIRIDPELLGGMIVQVGDEVFDSSVRTHIETIRNQLLARSSYEIQTGRDRFSSAS